MAIYCAKCGTQLADDAAFCNACGTKVVRNQDIPAFTPPPQSAPTFTPPQDTPVFTPPQGGAPVFTPPQGGAPVFTPPTTFSNGGHHSACHYHSNEVAVTTCARCGKPICQDCFDNYGVEAGEYAGEALCYDCCKELVAQNVADLTKNKNKIKFSFILSIIGMSIGFILGFFVPVISAIAKGAFSGELLGISFILGLVYAGVGGVFWSFIKFYFRYLWESIKLAFKSLFEGGGIGAIIGIFIAFTFGIIIEAFKSIYYTIKNTIDYIKYLKETSGFIESDTQALHQMDDYMEYTMIRNQNRGVDLETLLKDDSRLANNSYAHMVQERGEEGAEAALRNCVASINENGEIIRSFAA